MRLQLEEAEMLPCGSEALVDIEVAVLDIVGRSLDLDVAAGAERNFLSLRKLNLELLDEGGDVLVGDDGALPLLDAEYAVRNADVHVALDAYLAREPHAGLELLLVEVRVLDRERIAAA